MLSLEGVAGIPIGLDGFRIVFGDGLPEVTPSVRRLDEMREVLYNQTATHPQECYFMYRGVGLPEHKEVVSRRSLRYDVTVIPPGRIGNEYMKTAGHYHPVDPETGVGFPEVYEVLWGRAHYLLQKRAGRPDVLEDVVVIEAGPGDKVVIPPGYGHITINPGDEPLVMCNCVETHFASDYAPIREMKGGAYFEVEEDGQGVFIPNERYARTPPPRLVKPLVDGGLGLPEGVPLYACLTSRPESLDFLVRPGRHLDALKRLL